MPDLTVARDVIHEALRQELFGPAEEQPIGEPLDTSRPVTFGDWKEVEGPYHDAATGEEILTDSDPIRRYGVGVLYPADAGPAAAPQLEVVIPGIDSDHQLEPPDAGAESSRTGDTGDVADDGDDLDLSLANSRTQSSLGVSFHALLPAESGIDVSVRFATYESMTVNVAASTRTWWVRRPHKGIARFSAAALCAFEARRIVLPDSWDVDGLDPASVEMRAFSRLIDGQRLITITMTNRAIVKGNAGCLFQTAFEANVTGGGAILPYRERRASRSPDAEELSLSLLYRRHQTFAMGHGCAANWASEAKDQVQAISAECLPHYETPSVTPDIVSPNNSVLRVDMRALVADDFTEAQQQIGELLVSYGAWITTHRNTIPHLPSHLQATAEAHLLACDDALSRMQAGWTLVKEQPSIGKAFRLANRAMIAQQARSSAALRATSITSDGLLRVEGSAPTGTLPSNRGFWRPFQIAFFLASLPSTAHGQDINRDTIELIFFPTGGGKTEAYLGLAAFSIIHRRLTGTEANALGRGTDVLMRYTLRLLTAQQFLRAASLICALEQLRGGDPSLGPDEFSIGIWLGGDTTPNTRQQAVDVWNALAKEPGSAPNKFLLLRCPWCAAQMGPTEEQQKQRRAGRGHTPIVPGYLKHRGSVRLACPDRGCDFKTGLPLYVVDEDIYEKRPSLVIGTVDKFAMLAWREKARAIFGLDASGARELAPPNLIIQDEFHLISGPLGSMVGLYEAIIEDLCTDKSLGAKPKIVASTATIRRYEEQALAVYGRGKVNLFPPHGLDAEDAFFSVWARDPETKKLLPGRRYVGVHAPSLGSTQSVQVRVGAALMQAPLRLSTEAEQDPWWTNIWFFNSLRELGNTLSLMQSDIPDYIVGMRLRDKLQNVRYPGNPLELTGRRRDDEIPRAIQQLERRRNSGADQDAVTVCLASNIIEVGVDIERLSLMTIVGQPKTTAQYIQVSGRVGRRWQERPGLVVTIYGAGKPRDRSHYELFRSYHERLYAQVEPTSVTPFAKPVMQRALRAAIVCYVRMYSPIGTPPWPVPEAQFQNAATLLLNRLMTIDSTELAAADELIKRAGREWHHWGRAVWDANTMTGDPLNGLMRFPGSAAPPTPTWEIPASMRNVDAECRTVVTTAFHEAQAEVEAPA